MLSKMGFTYDSSMSALSDAERIWPYTLDYGSVNDCYGANNVCKKSINAPGLWEIPLYGTSGEGGDHLMDPFNDPSLASPLSPESVYNLYKNTFDRQYAGNRAPFGVYVHPSISL
jgi:hypothetical protein